MNNIQKETMDTAVKETVEGLPRVEDVTKYFFEIGHLKDTTRSGWTQIGIQTPESVAQHTYRAAIIGYVLASLTGADPAKTTLMCLFHDTAETRILDLHWTAKRYINVKEAEQRALSEQLSRLPQFIANSIAALVEEYEERSTREGLLAREADLLECIFQAREYQVRGYIEAERWIEECYQTLKTEEAKELARTCATMLPSEWFQSLKSKPQS